MVLFNSKDLIPVIKKILKPIEKKYRNKKVKCSKDTSKDGYFIFDHFFITDELNIIAVCSGTGAGIIYTEITDNDFIKDTNIFFKAFNNNITYYNITKRINECD